MSQISVAQPWKSDTVTGALPELVELRYGIEAPVAAGLLKNASPAGGENGLPAEIVAGEPALVVRLHPPRSGAAEAQLRAFVLTNGAEVEIARFDVEVFIERGPCMVHLDAHAHAVPRPILSMSMERETGRIVFARSSIVAILGLRGGTYDPPHAMIDW